MIYIIERLSFRKAKKLGWNIGKGSDEMVSYIINSKRIGMDERDFLKHSKKYLKRAMAVDIRFCSMSIDENICLDMVKKVEKLCRKDTKIYWTVVNKHLETEKQKGAVIVVLIFIKGKCIENERGRREYEKMMREKKALYAQ